MDDDNLGFVVWFGSPDDAKNNMGSVLGKVKNLVDALFIADRAREFYISNRNVSRWNRDPRRYLNKRRQHNIYIEWMLIPGRPQFFWEDRWHYERPEWLFRGGHL